MVVVVVLQFMTNDGFLDSTHYAFALFLFCFVSKSYSSNNVEIANVREKDMQPLFKRTVSFLQLKLDHAGTPSQIFITIVKKSKLVKAEPIKGFIYLYTEGL